MKKFFAAFMAAALLITACGAGAYAQEAELQDPAEALSAIYTWNAKDYTYHKSTGPKTDEELFTELKSYVPMPVPDGAAAKAPAMKAGFMAVMRDKSKISYYVSEEQLSSSEGVLNAAPERCKALLKIAQDSNSKKQGYPQWLFYMNTARITNGKYTDLTSSFETDDTEVLKRLGSLFNRITVKPGATKVLTEVPKTISDASLALTFDSGVVYDIYLTRDKLTVASSDMKNCLQYTLARTTEIDNISRSAELLYYRATGEELPERLKEINPDTGKPVIYLYPQTPTDCTVTLDYDDFVYTYPAYNGGWNVTAYPDGRLVNKADGTEHYYLFWDGSKRIDWRFDSGFCVKGSETEEFLRKVLPYMGLTAREYNDFITYWVPKLAGSPYNLITFAGEQYEQLAPLTVSPAPDSILRVHMVYKPLTAPVEIPEQTLKPFTRTGFTVVEWGGTIAR